MPEPIILYGTPTCPMVPPVRGILTRAGAEFQYIDISQDSAGNSRVREINNGNASVPTLLFPDGSTLTEPSRAQLQAKLKDAGFMVQPPSLLQRFTEDPFSSLMGLAALTFGIIDGGNWVFLALGVGFLAYVWWRSR
ncbi:MAG: glutathione S-transferase N-terminal domain-containing protein [Ardenticatenaceae bacterium]|nr:glutathione S-transferase N-terminal domain-containing protein [Anaerolineales bacterium]MCB8921256.1 glutathione S-transferase N-terminal domain-containing protein [Ardenticatenaceae bacterium]MCB8990622.1 glutathione S-transferase N-terminal domain-containing protein [Ardenticatenaceae bacterium]MCB9004329.1 glutathione S-transferase N-terminal domain-containing protein [Ardenticatenaceae bacterium]